MSLLLVQLTGLLRCGGRAAETHRKPPAVVLTRGLVGVSVLRLVKQARHSLADATRHDYRLIIGRHRRAGNDRHRDVAAAEMTRLTLGPEPLGTPDGHWNDRHACRLRHPRGTR